MLALDFRQGVAQRIQQVLVGGHDGAVHVEFDHGLSPAERLCLSRELQILPPDGGVGPFDRHARALAVLFLERRCDKIECAAADTNHRPVSRIQILQHPALMLRILVKDVDIASDQRRDAEPGQILATFASIESVASDFAISLCDRPLNIGKAPWR